MGIEGRHSTSHALLSTIRNMVDSRPVIAVVQLVHQPIGGVQSVLRELLPRLNNEFRVIVVDPYAHPRFAEQCQAAGLETAMLGPAPRTPYVGGKGTLRRPLLVLRRMPWMTVTLMRFRRWVKDQSVSAVWFNQLPAIRYFGRVLPRRGPAIIYHAHGFASSSEIGRRTAQWLSRRAAMVAAVSEDTGRMVIEAGVRADRVRVVYNGIDAERVRMRAGEDGPPLPGKPADAVVFLHAATLNRHKKAQHLAIEALGLMKNPLANLWICGDVGPDGDRTYVAELHQLVAVLKLTDYVHFLGWRRDLARVMAHADVVMMTSTCRSESFGMVLVEAMALGKPCIATNIGGPPEVIVHDQTGLIADTRPSSLADAMSTLASSSEMRTRFGKAGRVRAESHFTLAKQAQDFATLLNAGIKRPD